MDVLRVTRIVFKRIAHAKSVFARAHSKARVLVPMMADVAQSFSACRHAVIKDVP